MPVPVPSAADRHLLSRFSFGVTPDLVQEASDAGGARAWFEAQLTPAGIRDDEADALASWWPTLTDSYAKKRQDQLSGALPAFEQDFCFARWTLVHRITTRRQLQSVMTDLWSNLVFVPAPSAKTATWRPALERTIRAHALGKFVDLLTAAVLHPAMIVYLDNAKSTATTPNENLGRELLELHTVGRPAGYVETDVTESMRILTGYRVDVDGNAEPYYNPSDHSTGAVRVLGFRDANGSTDGRATTARYLAYLARHESTARRIAERLVRRFVSDQPPAALVDAVAAAYLAADTDIPTTLRALVDHPMFWSAAGTKVRTPVEDFVNTYRVLGPNVLPPTDDPLCAARLLLPTCAGMGQRPYDWPRPDGFPDTSETWTSSSRMLGSWRMHKNVAGGYYPKIGIEYQPKDAFLPQLPARLDEIVDTASRLVLARKASKQMINMVSRAVGATPTTTVTTSSVIYRFRIPLLLMALLDTPEHMSR